jgi:hypothetical protein
MFNVISSQYKCSILKDTLYHNPAKYDHFKYANCNCNVLIEQYVSYDGEHSWPGGLSTGGVNVSNQFSATYLMWQFFKNYTTTCQKTSTRNIKRTGSIQAFPNPFDDKIHLQNINGNEYCILYDFKGRLIWEGKKIEKLDFSHLQRGLYFLRVDNTIIPLTKS